MKTLNSLLFLAVYGAGQQTPPVSTPLPADPNTVLRVETNVVLVDAVVTDKKGNYVRDLKQKDFKVWEDNKEQTIKSFSFEADPASPLNNQPRYMVLFFDNSTMNFGDQAQARKAAASFIDTNAGPNRQMAIVNYSGALQITQNFTSDAERLKAVVAGTKLSVGPGPNDSRAGGLGRAAANFGTRNAIMAIRDLAKNLATIPGRKSLMLLTAGFRVTPDLLSDVTATIDVCNRSNVAIYPIDVRGLVAGSAAILPMPRPILMEQSPFRNAFYVPQGRGGSGTGTGSGGTSSGGTGSSGGGRGGAPSAPSGGTGSTGSRGSSGTTSTGTSNAGRTNTGTTGGAVPVVPPTSAARMIMPKIPESATTNQQVMYMLADGTGGFVIVNTNDLLGGMQKIAKEMNEFYLIGYTPPTTDEGKETCHSIRVKVDKGATVRARTGYCNAKLKDVLAQTPTEKTLEARVSAAQAGNVTASMQAPYFFTGANVARVNVAIELPAQSLKFTKDKGKERSTLNVLGIAYKKDGAVAARFSDAVKIDLENEKEVEAFQQNLYHYENQFDVASGEYNLKVAFSAGGENFGKLELPLVIEPYDTNKFSLSALALSKRFRKTVEVDQGLETALLEDRTPLIAQGYQVTPAGSTSFKKTDHAAMYLEVYEPALLAEQPPKETAVGLQIRVYDDKGVVKSDSGGFRIPIPEKGGNPAVPFAAQIPVSTLEPGSYKVVLLAVDNANNKVERSATFVIE